MCDRMNGLAKATGWVLLGWLFSCTASSDRPESRVVLSTDFPQDASDEAAILYAQHCALCHGATGDGDGFASPMLYPKVRDFGEGMFRIVSTLNGVPTDADLVGVLRRGLPGSAMPSYAWLGEDRLRGLAGYVRELTVRRIAEELLENYRAAGEALTAEQATEIAGWRMRPGDEVTVPPAVDAVDAELLARGRRTYLERCAACHGVDGRGQEPDARWRDFPNLQWARDLTAGVLEGGASHEDLVKRIVAGMPGAAMPPQRFAEPTELQALVAYVRALLPPDAEERGVTREQVLVAARTSGELPVQPDDLRWESARATEIVMMPLAARPQSISTVQVAALHDGARLAVRISWSDDTRDDRAFTGALPDGAAVQVSDQSAPPLFGMGTHEQPNDIWHWSAFRFRDVAGGLDLVFGPDGEPIYSLSPGGAAPGENRPAEGADELHSEGPGRGEVEEGVLQARPTWGEGRWCVVLVREMVSSGGVELVPGGRVRASFAIWNGSIGDRRGRKSISVWHHLELEP